MINRSRVVRRWRCARVDERASGALAWRGTRGALAWRGNARRCRGNRIFFRCPNSFLRFRIAACCFCFMVTQNVPHFSRCTLFPSFSGISRRRSTKRASTVAWEMKKKKKKTCIAASERKPARKSCCHTSCTSSSMMNYSRRTTCTFYF